MYDLIKTFAKTEDGATVVDMTMLMAALTGLALAITTQVATGLEDLSGEMETTIVAQDASAAW